MPKTNVVKYHYIPPKQFRKPAKYALKLYRDGHVPFTESIDISIRSFTYNPKDPDYVSPKILTHKSLRKHVLKIISSD